MSPPRRGRPPPAARRSAAAAFEEGFPAWHNVPNCVATSSGTPAIHTALAALDIGPGDEVIVPAHTFIASATPVLHQRAVPVFADVDPGTYCLSPESVVERITARTKAIVAGHLNGHPADLDALLAPAAPRGTAVLGGGGPAAAEASARAVAAEGVPIKRLTPTPLPKQPVFAGYGGLPCPVAERL